MKKKSNPDVLPGQMSIFDLIELINRGGVLLPIAARRSTMKVRLMGTKRECEIMQDFFRKNLQNSNGYSVSRLYPNMGSTDMCRLYVEFQLSPEQTNFLKLKGG